MMQDPEPGEPSVPDATAPPPRAFSQGVGTVFQVVGVTLFLGMTFVCCGSGLLSRDWATRPELRQQGWRLGSSDPARPGYSVQRAVTVSVTCGVFFGVALAGIGLGLQAQRPLSAVAGAVLSLIGWLFWIVQTTFAVQFIHSWTIILIAVFLALIFAALLGLSCVAALEMFRNPPPARQDILPAGYKIPYSHYHEDPPEVRLERELAERRQRLEVQQKELEALEEKLHRKLNEDQT